MLNNPTMRNFMESLLIGSIEYQKKKEDVQQFKTTQKKEVDNARNQKRRSIFGIKINDETASKIQKIERSLDGKTALKIQKIERSLENRRNKKK